jgi:hypothetical protein
LNDEIDFFWNKKGIAKCKSLVHFRLTNSPIGDEGLDSKRIGDDRKYLCFSF